MWEQFQRQCSYNSTVPRDDTQVLPHVAHNLPARIWVAATILMFKSCIYEGRSHSGRGELGGFFSESPLESCANRGIDPPRPCAHHSTLITPVVGLVRDANNDHVLRD